MFSSMADVFVIMTLELPYNCDYISDDTVDTQLESFVFQCTLYPECTCEHFRIDV